MNIEHPDITNAMRHGYPKKPEKPMYCCVVCGHEIFDGENYYDIYGECTCERCVDAMRRTAGEE